MSFLELSIISSLPLRRPAKTMKVSRRRRRKRRKLPNSTKRWAAESLTFIGPFNCQFNDQFILLWTEEEYRKLKLVWSHTVSMSLVLMELYIVICEWTVHFDFLIQIFILRWEWEPWSVRKATPVGCQVWPTAIRCTMDIQGKRSDEKWIKARKYQHSSDFICSNNDQTAEFDDLISALRTGDVFGENMDKFKRNRKSRNSPPRVERMESFLRERSNERILAPWETRNYFSDRAPVSAGVGSSFRIRIPEIDIIHGPEFLVIILLIMANGTWPGLWITVTPRGFVQDKIFISLKLGHSRQKHCYYSDEINIYLSLWLLHWTEQHYAF